MSHHMTDLVTWLHAQLDERERVARNVNSTWRLNDAATGEIVASDGRNAEVCAEAHWVGVGEHIVLNDPAYVLAKVDADRRILDLHRGEDGWCDVCAGATNGGYDLSREPAPCLTVRLLALPDANRPGYREEWRP